MAVRLAVVRQTDIPDQLDNTAVATNKGVAGLSGWRLAVDSERLMYTKGQAGWSRRCPHPAPFGGRSSPDKREKEPCQAWPTTTPSPPFWARRDW